VFAKAIGREELLGDARFAGCRGRGPTPPALVAELDRVFGTQPLAYWKKALDAPGCLRRGAGPDEIVKDPQLLANTSSSPSPTAARRPATR